MNNESCKSLKWFVCSVAVEKTQDNGSFKKVTDLYLVNAFNFAEAEDRIVSELSPLYPGGLEVKAVKSEKVMAMFENEAADVWYKARLSFVTIDEKTGLEKKAKYNAYAKADSLEKALKAVSEGMKGTLSDWEFFSIAETPIVDVFK